MYEKLGLVPLSLDSHKFCSREQTEPVMLPRPSATCVDYQLHLRVMSSFRGNISDNKHCGHAWINKRESLAPPRNYIIFCNELGLVY